MNRSRPDGIRLAMVTAVVGTVCIAAGAFWLSFTSLADLARRSGLGTGQSWAWPLIVDGIIVVATVAVVVLSGSRTAWYPWALLFAGALISVTGNALHAIVTASSDVPLALAAAVAAVPPLVLLAITHLTSVLARHAADSGRVDLLASTTEPFELRVVDAPNAAPLDGRAGAVELHASGWSNRAIAKQLGVHPSTVGRWLQDRVAASTHKNELIERS